MGRDEQQPQGALLPDYARGAARTDHRKARLGPHGLDHGSTVRAAVMRARAVWAALREWALRLSGTLRGRRADDDLRRELDSHLELAEEVLRQRGCSPQEAARLARVHFGRGDNALGSMRAQSSIPALSSFGLDIKLGSRMLRKSWGLTLVGGMAITIATAIGVGGSEFVRDQFAPTLPLEDGD